MRFPEYIRRDADSVKHLVLSHIKVLVNISSKIISLNKSCFYIADCC